MVSKILIFIVSLTFTVSCVDFDSVPKIDIKELTVQKIHDHYKKGNLTSQRLVEAYFNRIKLLDHTINSITILNPRAIEIAEKLDREFEETGKLRPLHGIPLIVKDNFNTEGLLTTAGALALKDFIPKENATMVQQLVDAGAIIIAKSNMAEWAFSAKHTESSTYGTTRNPYNTDYVPAGSSGGTGASIASNFGVLGLGSDTGNSIRGPSSHNSLVGFRTTIGLTSRYGIVPLYLRNDVGGPMCRTVEDATRMLQVIAGYDENDPVTIYSKEKVEKNYLDYLKSDGLKGARIGVLRQLSEMDPDPEITKLFNSAIQDLEKLGAIIIDPFNVPDFHEVRKNQWCSEFKQDIEAFLAEFVEDEDIKTIEDIIRIGTKSEYARKRLDYFKENSGRREESHINCENPFKDSKRIAFREAIENEMDKQNIQAIIYPTWNNKPALIDRFEEEYKGDNNQIIAPHTGQPAFTVPMGFTTGNLPAGLQFLGRMFDEKTLIKLSFSYEQGTKHRVPPNINVEE